MTTEQAMRDAKTRWQRRRRRLISYGQWQPFADAEPVRQHVLAIRAAGMGLKTLSLNTDVSISTLDHLLYGGSNFPPAAKIRVESAEALLAYWPRLDDYADTASVDGTGTRRRLQALAAIGWTAPAIHRHIDFCSQKTIETGSRENKKVTARFARAVRDFYAWASTGKAEDHGAVPWIAERARRQAARTGLQPPPVWDDDTIDDPDARPDWTGYCGSDRGYWMHRNQRLPMCQRCEHAHQEWLAEQEAAGRGGLGKKQLEARAAASNRGAEIAEDARELMRQGYSVEHAAARIGVTRQHLQQELFRHPEPAEAAAA